MSVGSVSTIIGRIKIASVLSPIAVFRKKSILGNNLDAVFADTVKTQEKIEAGNINYIGTFDKTMNMFDIRDVLRKSES